VGNHAIVRAVSDDDARLMERLAALEAEVKADADSKAAAKATAVAKVKDQRAAQLAESSALRERQAVLVSKRAPARRVEVEDDDHALDERASERDDLGSALALARRANGVKQELARAPKAGEKSWIKSGIASMLLGPLGWLYAGSFREAIPGSIAWVLFGAVASGLPSLLLMPVLLVLMPLSGIAGAMYAVQYNRKGSRQRLFNKKKDQKALAKKT
jgi:hypothetical protein